MFGLKNAVEIFKISLLAFNQLYSSKNSIGSQKNEQTKKRKKTVMHTDNRYTYCK